MTQNEVVEKWRDAFYRILELRGGLTNVAFLETEPIAHVVKDALRIMEIATPDETEKPPLLESTENK